MGASEIKPNLPWTIERFSPEDAIGVTSLFKSVYGEDYPIKKFIDPELLIEENLTNNTISSVAKTSEGYIVGHNAIFHSSPSDNMFESGAGLVHRHYRGGKGIFTGLGLHGITIAREEFQASAVWSEPVCNHPFAQKAVREGGGMETFGIELNLMPAEAYVQEKSASARVSTLMAFLEFNHTPHQIFIPPIYESWLKELYAKLGSPRNASVYSSAPRADLPSDLRLEIFDFAQVARIIVQLAGEDFEAVFNRAQDEALKKSAKVFQVWLRLSDPTTGWVVERLRQQGYFFGGLLPRWFDTDGLLMQKTLDSPNWETIIIVHDWSRRILEIIREDWKSVQLCG